MKKTINLMPLLIVLSVLLSSCEAIGAIFKAGIWTGIFIVAGIILLIILIARGLGKNK